MKSLLISLLENICPNNVYLQGTLSNDSYPETFITFWTNDVPDNSHYNNETTSYDWNFSVVLYSSNPTLVKTKSDAIRSALKNAGFIAQGKGNDIPSDKPTHTGWAMEFIYTEYL